MSWINEEGKFGENIYLVDSNLVGTEKSMCCYLIKGEKKTALIDTPCPSEIESFTKKLSTLELKLDVLIITHSHWDHSAGIPILQERYPSIEVMVGKSGLRSLRYNPEFNDGFNDFKEIPDLNSIDGLIPVKESDVIDLGRTTLSIVETPGHTDCSISIFESRQKVLFIGDAIGNIWTLKFIMPTIMPPEFSEEKLIQTFDKFETIGYNTLGLAHFGLLTGSIAKEYPAKAKESYIKWRDFFMTAWDEQPDKEYCSRKFANELHLMGFNDSENKIPFQMFGGWVVEGLKSGELI